MPQNLKITYIFSNYYTLWVFLVNYILWIELNWMGKNIS